MRTVRLDNDNHSVLGIKLSPTATGKGVVVTAVGRNSPASRAGVRVGEEITQINGKDVRRQV